MFEIKKNIVLIQQRITKAALLANRNSADIHLLAVSKTKPASLIREAFNCGINQFGENYLQEALSKQQELADLPIIWHFIGPIQSNKTKEIAEHFQWVHSVDRLKIAERLSNQRPIKMAPLQICIQVNISEENTKSGCHPDQLIDLAKAIKQLPNLELRGLMTIPKPTDDIIKQKATFATLSKLKNDLNEQLTLSLDTLSMGMSQDLEAAIAEGATWVRIGTAIFGERNYN